MNALIRKDFPILSVKNRHGKALVYLDNAASTQKPQVVIDSITDYYSHYNANIHRGVYDIATKATEAYNEARRKVQRFIHAAQEKECIFVRGTTEAINLVASSFVRPQLKAGDRIIISAMEHHANLVPWQMICQQLGAELSIIPMNRLGELDIDAYRKLLDKRTRFVALVHISNSLGTLNPIREMIQLAHQQEIPVLIDGAQSVPHLPIDVQALDCDFFTFSGHKLFGPMGIGCLYGKEAHLHQMVPYQFGGEMIRKVSFEETTFKQLPYKFEAGTPNVAAAIGLGVAIDYLSKLGMTQIHDYTQELLEYATEKMQMLNDLEIIGQAKHKSSIISFKIGEVHPHDVGTILNEAGIAIRAGHHCTQPVMQFFQIPGTARASFAFYNTKAEIDQLLDTLQTVKRIFS